MKPWSLLFAGVLLIGCAAAGPKVVIPTGSLPEFAAVLPFDNETVDLRGPEILRDMVNDRVVQMGYRTVPLEQVDAALRGIGITDGGQLGAVTPAEVGKALEVDGLLYGALEEFAYQNIGVIRRRVVRLRLRLVSAASGETMWEGSGKGEDNQFVVKQDRIAGSFVKGMAEKAVEMALKRPLEKESRKAVDKVFKEFPRR